MEQYRTFPGEMSLTPHSLWIKMPSFDEAKDLVSSQVNAIAASARKLEKFDARISYPGCKQPLRVLASMVSNDEVRIGVSRPQDWQLLRETEPVFLHKHY